MTPSIGKVAPTGITVANANEDIPSIHSSPNETTFDIASLITRSRAKQLEKEIHSQVNANLTFNNQIMLNGPMLLSTCFNVLRNDGVHEQAWDDDGFCPPNISKEPGRARERKEHSATMNNSRWSASKYFRS